MKNIQPIKFPILFRFDDMTVPCGLEFIKYWNFKHYEDNTFVMKESIYPEAHLHWIIDAEGLFRAVKLIKIERAWARPLRHLISLVKHFYEVLPGKRITISELCVAIEGTRDDPEKSSTKDLRIFLQNKQPEEIFSKDMYLEFMHEEETNEFPEYPKL